jgi:hypothetical protein
MEINNRSAHHGDMWLPWRQEIFAPIGSLIDISSYGTTKNFTREAVLEKALPVF